MPSTWAEWTGLTDLLAEYRGLIVLFGGFAWLYFLVHLGATLTNLFVSLVTSLGRVVQKYWAKRQIHKARLKILKSLTGEEKGYLAEYMKGITTLSVGVGDGIAGGLEVRGLIYQAAPGTALTGVPFNIQPWAREYLNKNPELLEQAIPYQKKSPFGIYD